MIKINKQKEQNEENVLIEEIVLYALGLNKMSRQNQMILNLGDWSSPCAGNSIRD